MIMNVSR